MHVQTPLILTLALDASSTKFFDELRKEHFPPEINYLSSHLTLFHKLPPDQPEAMSLTKNLISGHSPFILKVAGLMNLGKGVAYKLESDELVLLHRQLAEIWKPWLTPQDSQPLRPHITIQNKVEPKMARLLLDKLAPDLKPFNCQATGINCFEYLNGPWRLQTYIPFR